MATLGRPPSTTGTKQTLENELSQALQNWKNPPYRSICVVCRVREATTKVGNRKMCAECAKKAKK